VNSPWGLKGHVRVTPYTSNQERLTAGNVLLVRGEPREVLDVVSPKGYPMMLFAGYTSRTAAEQLRGELLEVDASDLPTLPEGEYYIDELVDLEVVTADGEGVGRLVEVLATGANDVYVVRREGRKDVLLPAIVDVVREVDIEGRRMIVELPPGLIDG
jgi:16S rRNA processing protein RimM